MSVVAVTPGPAAVAAPAVAAEPRVPMSTVSASSHLSALRMRVHPPCETDVRRRKLSEQHPSHQRGLTHQGRLPREGRGQQRNQPERYEPLPTAPVTRTHRCPA
ncbi:hypothetical protein Saso_28210 [Streptomyces asoensis]|uniref:Secreted protein n=1 Tax=Streptomyces asoensis TaxID=249586 RepID=A0ABQ3RZB8_9ACTN|nr:hypothetical protein GCM10010496_09790 [Streptomyces asoensis]GHI61171.1 hypothetical protein Saso_28210 [Streptomyces asoensis]